MLERHEDIEKLKSRIDKLSIDEKIELLKYLYAVSKNNINTKDLINGIDSIKFLLRDRSFLIDNFNGNDVTDFEVYYGATKIIFRIAQNNTILGTNQNGEFLIGTITNDMKLYLLKYSFSSRGVQSFDGELKGFVVTGTWSHRGNFDNVINHILLNNDCNLYKEMKHKKIEGHTLLLKRSYDIQPPKFKTIIQTIVNKNKSKNPLEEKNLTLN